MPAASKFKLPKMKSNIVVLKAAAVIEKTLASKIKKVLVVSKNKGTL